MLNPFRYGDVVSGSYFTDRSMEAAELAADIQSGQNVVIMSPRRYGKTSLVNLVRERLGKAAVRTAYLDLFGIATKAKLADRLAQSLYEGLVDPLERTLDRALDVFRRLNLSVRATANPDGSHAIELVPAARQTDAEAALERLLALPGRIAQDKSVRIALILDEFQEVIAIDPTMPAVMRSVFQQQGDVSHVFLGSRRHMMERVFTGEREPMYRLAKVMPLGPIPLADFATHIRERFAATGLIIDAAAVDALLSLTGGHPHDSQELAYFTWSLAAATTERAASPQTVREALLRVLETENAHFSAIWVRLSAHQRSVLVAIAAGEAEVYSEDCRRRHGLGAASSVQRSIERMLQDETLEQAIGGRPEICEPFFRHWVARIAGLTGSRPG